MNAVLKKELETLGNEVIVIRDMLRNETKKDTAMINQRLSVFDEFRLKVIDELINWD